MGFWLIPDNRLLLWYTATEPNDVDSSSNAGYLITGALGLYDGGPDSGADFVCDYEQKQKQYKLAGKDQAGHNATFLADDNVGSLLTCATKCGTQHRALSYNKSTGHCIFYITTSVGITALPAIQKNGYDMYDSGY